MSIASTRLGSSCYWKPADQCRFPAILFLHGADIVQLAYLMFIGLVGFSPVFLLDDNLVIQGAVTAYTAITLFMIALSIRPGEGDHLFKVFRPVALLALAIPIWMVI